MNLYAELQINPRNITSYRNLSEYYSSIGKENEAKAFLELIQRKFHGNDPNLDEKQQPNY